MASKANFLLRIAFAVALTAMAFRPLPPSLRRIRP
jgi:hypothetical protein